MSCGVECHAVIKATVIKTASDSAGEASSLLVAQVSGLKGRKERHSKSMPVSPDPYPCPRLHRAWSTTNAQPEIILFRGNAPGEPQGFSGESIKRGSIPRTCRQRLQGNHDRESVL